jgi:hypothetical protein
MVRSEPRIDSSNHLLSQLEVDDLVQHFKARREAILIFLGCKISQRKRSKRERKRK